jgi:hypothetical protein
MHADDKLTAYAAASQALAAAGVRQVASLEFEDQEVGSVAVIVHRDGSCEFTLSNEDGVPIGGGSL